MYRNVLRLLLNLGRDELLRRPVGKEFQTDGARKLNERSPADLRLREGSSRILSLAERSVRDGRYMVSTRARYDGREPLKCRKANTASLYWQRYFIGSQWSSLRSGVT